VRYFIELFWSCKDFSPSLPDKSITQRAVKRFNITARLAQLAAKQAKEIVRSQRKKSLRKRRMPKFKNIALNLDSRFFTLTKFRGHFDWAIRFSSGIPSIVVPFNNTKHTLKFLEGGWSLSNSIRIGLDKKGIWIDMIFEKPRPSLKEQGEILGVDLGYRCLLATSRGELLGTELRDKISKAGPRRKSFHHYIKTEANRVLKMLDLSNIKALVVENLRNVKRGKRGKFSRKANRLLSFWHYARVINRLRQLCEEQGVLLLLKDPWKTSQRCPICGKIDSRNRNVVKFKCIYCGFEEWADIVGALNLAALGLAGAYSLRSLQANYICP
jgi:IS605 OrfB family transposase